MADKFPGLIFQKNNNTIKGFNKKFIETFAIDKTIFANKVNSNMLNIEDLFNKLQQLIEQMKNKSG